MTALLIREVSPSDRAALAFSLSHLGERSRHQRYFTAMPALRARELDRLARVDHWHREALIAFSAVPRAPVGVAEYIRLERFDVAEVAVAVVDRWQQHGVGHALVRALRDRAFSAGVRRFAVTVLRDNKGALALARGLGKCTTVAAEGMVLQLLVDLPPGVGEGRATASIVRVSHARTASATASRSPVNE
jgi:RimJ/RimL family protein N-acetyltransferase